MCYWSVEHSGIQTADAVVGQELYIQRQYGHYGRVNWIVDQDFKTPVCLKDGTEMMCCLPGFPVGLHARLRMFEEARMDVFCFEDGRKISLDSLDTHGVRLAVLSIPGMEPITRQEQAEVEALRKHPVPV